jgi:hypothetical protein
MFAFLEQVRSEHFATFLLTRALKNKWGEFYDVRRSFSGEVVNADFCFVRRGPACAGSARLVSDVRGGSADN